MLGRYCLLAGSIYKSKLSHFNLHTLNLNKTQYCDMPQDSILGPLFFLIYINDLPTIINNDNNMILFADDTSIIITDTNQTFQDINTWFKVSLFYLNLNKIQYLEFRSKNYYNVNTQIKYDQECITSASEIKFLGLIVDNTLS